MKWRLLDTGCRCGFENMAIDEAVMELISRGKAPPTLRFYGWDPPALTLGYFQDPGETADLEACRRLGIDVVRRPTGGRAVLHSREVTYSIIAPEDNPAVTGTVSESYRRLSRGLILGLSRLGAEVKLSEDGANASGGPACFDSPARYELVAGGRKLAGSAQGRRNGVVLQHGALPLENDAATLFTLLKFPTAAQREDQQRRYTLKATSLEEVLGRPVSPGEVVPALAQGFAEALGIELDPGELTGEEERQVKRLLKEKYVKNI